MKNEEERKRKPGGGRKTKLDNKKVILFLGGRENGMSIQDSATLAGISKVTAHSWINKGKKAIEEIEESKEKDEDYDETTHPHYDFYMFQIANIQGDKKLSLELRKNLRTLAKDRNFVDKDGVKRIDKAGSVAANLALLKTVDDDFKEDKEGEGSNSQVIIFNDIKEEDKDDILERMSKAQNKQTKNLLNNDINENGEIEND